MSRWSDQQQAAIDARNRQILVSAAAGSGKTSVLIERLMSLLRGGTSLERMLVVTFTQAAASEMRKRLGEALTKEAPKDRHLRKQRAALKRCDIGTLHGICKKIIDRHFQAAELDPMARVGDEARLKALRERALAEVMEELYENPGPDGQRLVDQYTDLMIEQMVRQLHFFLMSQDSPWQWLEAAQKLPDAEGLKEHPWYRYLLSASLEDAEAAMQLFEDNLRLCALPDGPARYNNNAAADLETARAVRESLLQEGGLPGGMQLSFTKLSSAKVPPEESEELQQRFKAQRDDGKELLQKLLKRLPAGEAGIAKAAADLAFTWPALRALCALTQRFHERYSLLKDDHLLLDFDDLEHKALRCLKVEQVRQDIASQYDALFVDEYQDISRTQEAIIQALLGSGASLFMVGDVKQSIYRFRLADPGLFLHKYASFTALQDAPERLIHLSRNYRSRENLLAGVNQVFQDTMRGDTLEITYDAQAALYPGKESEGDPPIELHLILPMEGEPLEEPEPEEDGPPERQEPEGEQAYGPQREALIIAQRIRALLNRPIREGDGERPLRYRDMVILLRSASGRAKDMAEVLKDSGIPIYSDADQQHFDLQEVSDALSLLTVLDNPLQDIPLLTVLRGPAFCFDEEEIGQLRARAKEPKAPLWESFLTLSEELPRVKEAREQLDRWRFLCEHSQLDAFLRRLIRESGLYAQAGAKPQGALRRANLRLLCERAAPNPEPQTLHGFLSRVTEARRQENTRAASPLGAGEDLVRIMTIHKSKGLEFPVVFLPDLARAFHRDGQGELMIDVDSGLALRLRDTGQSITHATLGGHAIELKKGREMRSEEARLLYVAMTRARDRLILLAAPRSLKSSLKFWQKPDSDARAAKAGCMLDWVGASLFEGLREATNQPYQADNGSQWQFFWHDASQLRLPMPRGRGPRVQLSKEPPGEAISRRMAGPSFPPAQPLKLSVTQLTQRLQEPEEETAETKRQPRDAAETLPALPRGASLSRGTATHKALSAVGLSGLHGLSGQALRDALRRELERLEAAGVLRGEEARLVDIPVMAAFLESRLGQGLLLAKQPEREWAFSLLTEEGVILQGVLDCCYLLDGGWVLIDYKTDRAAPETILHRYRDQMRWYMRALRDITGLPVREASLYALSHGQAIPVTEDAPIRFEGLPPQL